MRVALTGTPGTGKTTVAGRLDSHLRVVDLGALIEAEHLDTGHDPVRNTAVVDMAALTTATEGLDDVILESHLSHHLPVDRVVVLRCEPTVLEGRLRERGATERSVRENAESEALDLILAEAVAQHGREAVYEVDTTDREIAAVVSDVEAAITGTVEPSAGTVDFTGYL